jgi:catechol 2,3-dioxygenase-like lactoylglutathione lyase family enzyme
MKTVLAARMVQHQQQRSALHGCRKKETVMAEGAIARHIQHVSVPRPRGSQDQARRFYTELLGLQEVQPPASLQALNLVWYRLGDSELHLFEADAVPQGLGAHFCIQVDDLQALRERLTGGGVRVIEDIPITNRPRFFVEDPFGNRIELTTILGDYD